ncbi:hypothetical protein SADUNF_Sadunf09G0028800 [Salix dunnii]|uniref:Uncharacterized protein n=1 Tax=Salix dunnii TaxID=1413687 RepID=A0A835JS01_9ROSI|nr:hypothetical protein SADUNF_Sadunf09G0028800 [Salix dunnii]
MMLCFIVALVLLPPDHLVYTYKIIKDDIVAREDHGIPVFNLWTGIHLFMLSNYNAISLTQKFKINLYRISLRLVKIRERTYKSISFFPRNPTPFLFLHFYKKEMNNGIHFR